MPFQADAFQADAFQGAGEVGAVVGATAPSPAAGIPFWLWEAQREGLWSGGDPPQPGQRRKEQAMHILDLADAVDPFRVDPPPRPADQPSPSTGGPRDTHRAKFSGRPVDPLLQELLDGLDGQLSGHLSHKQLAAVHHTVKVAWQRGFRDLRTLVAMVSQQLGLDARTAVRLEQALGRQLTPGQGGTPAQGPAAVRSEGELALALGLAGLAFAGVRRGFRGSR